MKWALDLLEIAAITILVLQKDEEGSVVPDEDAKDADTTEDFRLNRTNDREPWTRGRGRRGGHRGGRRGGFCREVSDSPHHEAVAGPGEANKENVVGQEQATAEKSAEGASGEVTHPASILFGHATLSGDTGILAWRVSFDKSCSIKRSDAPLATVIQSNLDNLNMLNSNFCFI